jgi:arylsulfatase
MTLQAFFITVLAVCLGLCAEAENRPNIVLIMADDMGYSDIGCYGSEISTPHLDQLAADGLRFRQMYNTSKCSTTRSCLLTGRYVSRKSHKLNSEHGPILGELLQAQGYRTLWSGKNHSNIRPPERGFDRFYGFQGGACSFWNPGDKMPDGSVFPSTSSYEWMVDDEWIKPFVPKDPDYYMTDAITDTALQWLGEYKDDQQPFFLYLAYNSPHWPLHAKDQDIAKFKGTYDVGYQVIRAQRYQRMIEAGVIDKATTPLFPEDIPEWTSLSKKEQKLESQRMEVFAAMVDNLDQNIGRVIDHLKADGKWDNTIVFFLSDNGASHEREKIYQRAFKKYKPTGQEKIGGVMTFETVGPSWARVSNTPFAKHKSMSHEGGVCTPMVVRWGKGITGAGAFTDTPAHVVDILPTLVELSGGSYPNIFNEAPLKPMEGISLVPTFTGSAVTQRNIPIGFDFGGGQGVRDGVWKLVRAGKQPWELYNLKTDRSECNNLASDYPERVAEMEASFNAWVERCNSF